MVHEVIGATFTYDAAGGEAEYFCERIWTGQISLNQFAKIVPGAGVSQVISCG